LGSGASKLNFGASESGSGASNLDFGASELGSDASKLNFGASESGSGASNLDFGASETGFDASMAGSDAWPVRLETSNPGDETPGSSDRDPDPHGGSSLGGSDAGQCAGGDGPRTGPIEVPIAARTASPLGPAAISSRLRRSL